LKDKSADKISKWIETLVIQKLGIPESIQSDNGKEFRNLYIDKIIKKYNFTWSYNSPGHHKGTGCVKEQIKPFFENCKKYLIMGGKIGKTFTPCKPRLQHLIPHDT
ncbi:hypothetical protein COBT_003019, partial [Conglomerata obtusa]